MFEISGVHWLVILGALISVGGAFAYIRDTLAGKTKPNRVTWTMWAVAPLIGTFAAVASNADLWATARIFLAGFIPLLVVGASFFNRQSTGSSPLSTLCVACPHCSRWLSGEPLIRRVSLFCLQRSVMASPRFRQLLKLGNILRLKRGPYMWRAF